MSLTTPWYPATSAGPTARGRRGRGRQVVWRLAQEQGRWAILQFHVPGEHEINSLQVSKCSSGRGVILTW